MANLIAELEGVVAMIDIRRTDGRLRYSYPPDDLAPAAARFFAHHHAEIAAAVMDAARCWAIHLKGPDDVIAAPSKLAAEIVARNFNAYWDSHKHERGHDVRVVAEVIEWEFSPLEHAKSVIQSFPEYADLLDDAAMSARAGAGG